MVQDAARLQLAVGLYDVWVHGALVWLFGTAVLGAIHPFLGAFGWLGLLLIPFGMLEVALALHVRQTQDPRWCKRLAQLQILSIGLLGLPAALVGVRVLRNLGPVSPSTH